MQCYNCNAKRLKYNTEKDAYICLNCGYVYPKQYFFISHSHLDIEKVRLIRNTIEETFFYEPILFFLKCLSDNNELQDLLQREISERIWFVYCKSANAENSKYVQQERKYVNDLVRSGKNIHIIEIELDKYNIWNNKIVGYINNQISFQIRKTKLFISYSIKNRAIVNDIKINLTNAGYAIWDVSSMFVSENIYDSVQSNIKKHCYKDGAIIYIVSESSLNNFTVNEINFAFEQGAFIVPVILDESDIPVQELQYILNKRLPNLAHMQSHIIHKNTVKKDTDTLIEFLKNL